MVDEHAVPGSRGVDDDGSDFAIPANCLIIDIRIRISPLKGKNIILKCNIVMFLVSTYLY